MMQTFLQKTADHLLQNHSNGLADVCVVLPNRRAGLFLKKQIATLSKKTLWSPDIFAIEDFLTHLSGFKKLDPVALLFELYEVHKELEKINPQEFEQFTITGQMMLSDFNELDMNLVDAKTLFGYLNEVKAIEKWNPGGQPLTKAEREYLAFYNALYDYYAHFNARLSAQKYAYPGMIYRHAAQNTATLAGQKNWEKIYFAGFNALTKAEEKVIGHMRDTGRAEILRDADAYYLEDEKQEAGEFLRKQLKSEGKSRFGAVSNFFAGSPKNIHVHGVPRNEGQAVLAGKILQEWLNPAKMENEKDVPTDLSNAAVVLADEGLLIPVLNALPEQLKAFNVTMGFPLRLTPACNFIMLIIRMFENTGRFRKMKTHAEAAFYHRDILKILQHSMPAGAYNTQPAVFNLRKSKKIFYKPDEVFVTLTDKNSSDENKDGLHDLMQIIFSDPAASVSDILQIIARTIHHFRDHYTRIITAGDGDKDAKLQIENLYHTALLIKRMNELHEKYKSITSIRTLREIYRQLSATGRIPFSGEPLSGLQIMGMLETRTLDFEKIILISANEGILPASGMHHSLIPYDVQVEMKLPTHNQKNAVFAYHFYRLLQRAKEIHLIYNTEPDELGGGEKSRFIHQIIHELPLYNPEIKITTEIENLPPPGKMTERVIEIKKTEKVFQSLTKKSSEGLSPTSLNQYRRCPLQFYFRNLAKLKEIEEVEENIEYKTIGSIVHKVFEDLYLPFKGKVLQSQDVDRMKDVMNDFIEKAFLEYFRHGQVKFGKNRLIYEVIKNFVVSFLDFEKGFIEKLAQKNGTLQILDLEQEVVSENIGSFIPGAGASEIKLTGFIDRVDKCNGTIRIIDYKTGMVNNASELQISDWENFTEGHKKDKAFQVLLYAWLYHRTQFNGSSGLTGGIFSIPKMSNGLMKFGVKAGRNAKPDENIDEEKLENFEQYLMSLLTDIFNKEIPFTQTERKDTCKNCDFKDICRR